RIVLGLVVTASVISAVFIGRKPYGEELKKGDVSPRAIYAPIDFKYQTGIDQERTKLKREKAAEAIDGVYDIGGEVSKNLLKEVDKFFDQVIAIQNLKEAEEEELSKAKSALVISISEANIKAFLADSKPKDTKAKTKDLLNIFLSKGITTSKLEKRLIKSGRSHVMLRNLDTQVEAKVPIENFLTLSKAKKEITSKVQGMFPENRKLRIAVIDLSEKVLESNLQFNEALTNERRKLAYDNSPMQYKEKEVRKEELIITRG
ncbi:unnamed protein product, partial [marine sediment metagenome]